jgi:mannitol 2-dehydrogenase
MNEPAQPLTTPAYDRGRLTPGIVHIGVGNFHRAHMAVYLDDLFAMGESMDWAIIGGGVRPADAVTREALRAQDYLSTVIELDPKGKSARRIGAMIDFAPIEMNNASLIAAMSRPEIRIVSLTVTEGGYFIAPDTGEFDPTAPEIIADATNPHATAFGAIIAALKVRRAAGIAPFTVMSCDNLPGNGQVTRAAVVGLAELSDPELAAWIAANVAFPNSMVDRITPATGPRERAIAQEFCLNDPAPVTCEPFRQWVLEDTFPAGRPAFEKVGVTLTSEVHIYERIKIGVLNGGHAVIAYPGGLLEIEYVHEAMADPLISAFLDKVEQTEILPVMPQVGDIDLARYYATVRSRFSNPEVADTERRLCFDGSNRQPKFIVPTLREALTAGLPAEGLALASALWCRYCAGISDKGKAIPPNDPNWETLNSNARAAQMDPKVWLNQRPIYGDLAENLSFAATFSKHLIRIRDHGTEAALRQYLGF